MKSCKESIMKKRFLHAALACALCAPLLAQAACFYNGQWYPTGTRLGSLTCQADGQWR
jgi:hypothetical protein